ncbi:mammalian cell entry protein [Mycolicibacterium fortuitum]|uniref:MCE family protein n=1 Tax=Mycolicibacterium fortuitum TaxID=1766 RepID=UPI0007EA1082|nr:MlaD family protein [Mycolicibacterium fortuitum]OBG47663.1 mammalian cell entry protein [Mycolicibacterium fortuitum]
MAKQTKAMRRIGRPLESYNKITLGLIALVTVSALIGALLLAKMLDIGYRTYTAQFQQAAALQTGNPITIAGIQVGKVGRMKLAGDHVEVRLKVRNNIALGQDTRAAIKITTVLGSRYLTLQPGGTGPLPNNTISLTHTEVPYDLQEALADATTTYEQVNTDQFAESLGVLGKQLSTLPPVVPESIQNVHTLSTIVADRRDQMGALLKTTELVSNTLRRQQASIGTMINQGNQLVGEFVARQATFHAMMRSLTNVVNTLSDLAIENRPQLEQLLKDVRALSDMLGQHDDLLRSTLQSGPVALRGLANATGTGNAMDMAMPNGFLVDSWMCAISGRAKQFGLIQYFKDCK